MKAIIAEKPSVANELARIVGATGKREGYFEGGGFLVTWAFGHLVGLAMPEDYGIKGFNRESLPIIPAAFKLLGRKVKSGNGYVYDEGSKKQLEIIHSVFNKCDSIIVATDAGREGEVIFRFIYQYLGCTKPFERLWINSLTEKAIIQGFQNLKQGSEFNGLFAAGRERSQCDWLVGVNATQALTIAMGDGLFSLGRVQTPTLALICKRFLAHKAFEVKNYFQLELSIIKEAISFRSQSEDKWEDKEKAESIMRTLERCGKAELKEMDKKSGTIQAPLLFDLTGLQKEANKKLGYSAERTLEIAQKLYEKKFITYPRTGSKYVPEDIWPEIPALILALGSRPSCKEAVDHIKWERYNKHIVNDVKVTDHHGILITENIPTRLEGSEDALYDMIAKRLLESISPPCHREITDIRISALHYDFKLKAIRITSAGWKLINGNFEQEGEDLVTDFPDLQTGRGYKIRKALVFSTITAVLSCVIVILLFLGSEHIVKKENNFTRRFLVHPVIEEKKILDLDNPDYYFAGYDDGHVYLGNRIFPQILITADTGLQNDQLMKIEPDNMNHKFSNLRLQVNNGFYYFYDGTIPIIYRGRVGNPNAKTLSFQDAYFNQLIVLDSARFALRTQSSATKHFTLALLDLNAVPKIKLFPELLRKQIDGVFDVDGNITYDRSQKNLIYTYLYRNEYLIMDDRLNLKNKFNTIDTTRIAQIKITKLADGRHKMNAPPLKVNRQSVSYGGVLFNQSDLMGKLESREAWKAAKVIDMYRTDRQEYIGSFYIYNKKEMKMHDFMITEKYMYVLRGDEVVRYRIRDIIKRNYIRGDAENLHKE